MNKISDAEEKIMSIVWFYDGVPTTTKNVAHVADPDLFSITERCSAKFGKNWKFQTVATFLTRLVSKGYLTTYRIGRYTHYKPVITLEDYQKEKLSEVNDILFQGNMEKLITFVTNINKQ